MIRTIARPLLASAFVLDGVQMLKNTDDYTEETKAMVDNARRVLPPSVLSYIPNDAATTVRVAAGAKIAGALMLGTSKAPRLGAGVLTAIQIPTSIARNAFWAEKDSKEKKNKQRGLITDLALVGGLAITTADTAGKPGIAWRVQKAMPGKSQQEKMLANAQGQAQGMLTKAKENAIAGKEAVTTYVDDHSDEWKETASNLREQAKEFGDQAKVVASAQAANLSAQASDFGDRARVQAAELGDVARVQAADFNDRARVQSADLRERARVQSAELRKQAKKAQKRAQKQAKKKAKQYR